MADERSDFRWCLVSLLALGTACGGGGSARDEPDSVHRARPSNLTCVAPPRPVEGASVATELAFPNLGFNQPIHLLLAPGDDSRVFVVQKQGAVKVIANTPQVSSADTFIDLTSKVNSVPNEAGLLGMAFHPEFSLNGQVFLSYTTYGGPPEGLVSVVSRFRSTDGGRTLDPATEEVLLTQEKVTTRHNGGSIAFGPDGYLYIGFGDGGGPPDDGNPAQDVGSLQGKLLRIDVDVPAGYGIPPGNPFASGGGRPEVFAWGFRNPWRFSFDRVTGELWAGDVGEESWEEVNRVVLGGNYGWPIREGSRCFARDTCASAGLIPPVAEYPHSEGVSVTGGLVYRGSAIPSLYGSYFYADFVSGRFWALLGDPSSGQLVPQLLMSTDKAFVAFAELTDGEVLGIDMATGKLHRLVAAEGSAASSTFPQTLSATGCFEADQPGPTRRRAHPVRRQLAPLVRRCAEGTFPRRPGREDHSRRLRRRLGFPRRLRPREDLPARGYAGGDASLHAPSRRRVGRLLVCVERRPDGRDAARRQQHEGGGGTDLVLPEPRGVHAVPHERGQGARSASRRRSSTARYATRTEGAPISSPCWTRWNVRWRPRRLPRGAAAPRGAGRTGVARSPRALVPALELLQLPPARRPRRRRCGSPFLHSV